MSNEVLTIPQIDAHIAKHLGKLKAEELDSLDLCKIYQTIRPALIFIRTLLFWKPDWQVILQKLIDALDASCGTTKIPS